jgi:Transposase IS66 family
MLGETKSPLGKALLYFQRQEPRLAAFLDHGILPISTAHVERLLRTVP